MDHTDAQTNGNQVISKNLNDGSSSSSNNNDIKITNELNMNSYRGSDASDCSQNHLMVTDLFNDAGRKSSISFDKIKQISLTYSLQSEDSDTQQACDETGQLLEDLRELELTESCNFLSVNDVASSSSVDNIDRKKDLLCDKQNLDYDINGQEVVENDQVQSNSFSSRQYGVNPADSNQSVEGQINGRHAPSSNEDVQNKRNFAKLAGNPHTNPFTFDDNYDYVNAKIKSGNRTLHDLLDDPRYCAHYKIKDHLETKNRNPVEKRSRQFEDLQDAEYFHDYGQQRVIDRESIIKERKRMGVYNKPQVPLYQNPIKYNHGRSNRFDAITSNSKTNITDNDKRNRNLDSRLNNDEESILLTVRAGLIPDAVIDDENETQSDDSYWDSSVGTGLRVDRMNYRSSDQEGEEYSFYLSDEELMDSGETMIIHNGIRSDIRDENIGTPVRNSGITDVMTREEIYRHTQNLDASRTQNQRTIRRNHDYKNLNPSRNESMLGYRIGFSMNENMVNHLNSDQSNQVIIDRPLPSQSRASQAKVFNKNNWLDGQQLHREPNLRKSQVYASTEIRQTEKNLEQAFIGENQQRQVLIGPNEGGSFVRENRILSPSASNKLLEFNGCENINNSSKQEADEVGNTPTNRQSTLRSKSGSLLEEECVDKNNEPIYDDIQSFQGPVNYQVDQGYFLNDAYDPRGRTGRSNATSAVKAPIPISSDRFTTDRSGLRQRSRIGSGNSFGNISHATPRHRVIKIPREDRNRIDIVISSPQRYFKRYNSPESERFSRKESSRTSYVNKMYSSPSSPYSQFDWNNHGIGYASDNEGNFMLTEKSIKGPSTERSQCPTAIDLRKDQILKNSKSLRNTQSETGNVINLPKESRRISSRMTHNSSYSRRAGTGVDEVTQIFKDNSDTGKSDKISTEKLDSKDQRGVNDQKSNYSDINLESDPSHKTTISLKKDSQPSTQVTKKTEVGTMTEVVGDTGPIGCPLYSSNSKFSLNSAVCPENSEN